MERGLCELERKDLTGHVRASPSFRTTVLPPAFAPGYHRVVLFIRSRHWDNGAATRRFSSRSGCRASTSSSRHSLADILGLSFRNYLELRWKTAFAFMKSTRYNARSHFDRSNWARSSSVKANRIRAISRLQFRASPAIHCWLQLFRAARQGGCA